MASILNKSSQPKSLIIHIRTYIRSSVMITAMTVVRTVGIITIDAWDTSLTAILEDRLYQACS